MSQDALNPNSTPSTFKKGFGVRRLNKVPLVIAGVIIALFVSFMAWVAILKHEQQQASQNKVADVSTNVPTLPPQGDPVRDIIAASGIASGPDFGAFATTIIPEEAPPELPPEPGRNAGGRTDYGNDLPEYELPPQQSAEEMYQQEYRRRIVEQRIQRLEVAISTKSTVPFESQQGNSTSALSSMQSSGNPMAQLAAVQEQLKQTAGMLTGSNPTADYQSRLNAVQQQLSQSGMGGASAAMPAGLMPIQEQPPGYEQFEGDKSRWALNNSMQTPKPYTLSVGWMLPGQFVGGINSDLPGQIKGIISRNVYDSATGKHLLIPQGTEAIGQYGSDVIYGQERILFAWQRLNFPDGRYLDLGSMQGADRGGYAGVKDQVNNHFMRVFGSAALMSFVTAGIEISQNDDGGSSQNSRRSGDALSEALGQQLGQATAQIIMRNLNIAPTLEIREGNKFSILVTKDITFDKPYKDFDY
jgi:type IV secretory pathway VirB10-like protein